MGGGGAFNRNFTVLKLLTASITSVVMAAAIETIRCLDGSTDDLIS